ncbi:Putative Polysaccharide deacetylase family protein [Penicillium digitatum]|uniref:Polysaccharide deacetylase family protein n=1 Tax=Penicillium digitatum TaxID=36651 RepID=A0A7T7BKT7_PENDI|nr:Putative Polysaccharide deacetylase family protein [Penicillium digitatum]
MWKTSKEGAQLLLDNGIEYGHSMSHEDCQASYLRTGDSWTQINYTQKVEIEWSLLGMDTKQGLLKPHLIGTLMIYRR